MVNKKAFIAASKASFPFCIAYLPLGILFGLIFENQGYPWFLGPIMSFFVYGGSVQFLALSMMEQNTPLLELLLACFFVAFRNLCYGPSLFERFKNFSMWRKFYLGWGLIDAMYALLLLESPVQEEDDSDYCLYLCLIIHTYWVLGAVIGGFAGNSIPTVKGLEFVFTLLFAIFALEAYLKNKLLWPLVIGMISWILSVYFIPNYALLGAIIVSIIAFASILKFRKI